MLETATGDCKKTIMVVEDDLDVRETLAALLELEGYHVTVARHGREALALLGGASAPCVILLDLWMPVMDGQEFRRAQSSNEAMAEIPVVVVSASSRLAEIAGTMGVQGFIQKPITYRDLTATVARFC